MKKLLLVLFAVFHLFSAAGQNTDIRVYPLDFHPISLKAADMNNDGHPDLILMTNVMDTLFAVFPSTGNGNLSPALLYKKEIYYSRFDVGDLNRDNLPEMVISSYWSNGFRIYNGSANFGLTPVKDYTLGGHASDVTITDIDKDGLMDIMGITTGSGTPVTLRVMKGDGNGNFQNTGNYPTLLSLNLATTIADKNGDGLQDVLVTTREWIALFYQQRNGTFLLKYWPTYSGTLAISDLNKDQNPDLILAYSTYSSDQQGDSLVVRLGEADTLFSLKPFKILTPGLNPATLCVADINHDTYPDLLASHYNFNFQRTDSLFLFRGLENGRFRFEKILKMPAPVLDIAAVDLDGDPYPEIVTISSDQLIVLANHGNVLSSGDPVLHKDLRIYPNPAADHLYLQLPDAPCRIRFTDMLGRTCYESIHSGLFRLDTGSWSPGTYILQVFQKDEPVRSALVVKQ